MFKKEFHVLFSEYTVQFVQNYGFNNEYTKNSFLKTYLLIPNEFKYFIMFMLR